MNPSPLNNPVWATLSGDQRHFSAGTDSVRRYLPGFSAILGFADPSCPDLREIEPFCEPGEAFYTDIWAGDVPEGWTLERETKMFKMVWKGSELPAYDATLIRQLDLSFAPQAVDLALLTNPGPFGLRTMELGDYFGFVEDGQLIAMAGERMSALPLREVSGVCTHPDFQGKGLARGLMIHVMSRMVERGERPFLHVISTNETARALYRKLGYQDHLETVVRVIRWG